jgi:hypothetical protein
MTSETPYLKYILESTPQTTYNPFLDHTELLHFRLKYGTANMSSLTNQESSETQPNNPVNSGGEKGVQDDPSVPTKVGDKSSSGLSSGIVDKVDLTFCILVSACMLMQRQTSAGTKNASDTSEQRSGEDVKFNTQQDPKGSSEVGTKTGSESLIDSVESSVHERGEAEHSRAD